MTKRFQIVLTPEQRHELEHVRDTDHRPYMRERAAAILKVADGQSARQVARHRLLKRRHADTVAAWVRRYLAEGLAGLQIKPGRGRKPAFSPQHPTAEAAAAELQEVVRRSPRLYGLKRSRWWLDGLRQSVDWLRGLSLPGVHKILCRLGVKYKRGRRYVHSPDPEYDEKLAQLQAVQELV
ncbi:MAG: helix-turn-helix domain-containing protein, partial [Anaerolineae bacterium]